MGSPEVRPPRQARSRRTMDGILAAARDVVAAQGFEQASITEITDRAGVAVGTFYTRFENKDALLHALHEQQTARSRQVIHDSLRQDRLVDRTVREVLTEVVQRSLEVTRSIAGFQRACYQRALSDPVFAERELRVRRDMAARLHELVPQAAGEIGHPDPERAIEFCCALYVSVITDHVNASAFGASTLDDEQLADELVDAMCAYLRVPC